MVGAILFVVFVGSLPVCFFRPFYGLVLWTIVAFLNPQAYMWGLGSSFPLALAVAIPTMAGLVVYVPGWTERLACRETYLIVLLWAWFTVTTLISVNTAPLFDGIMPSDTWEKWGMVSKILLMTVVMIAAMDSFRQLRILILAIAGSFGFYVLKSFPFMLATGGEFRLYGPDNSMVADNNDFGLALNVTIPLFFLLAQTETTTWMKRLFGFLFVIAIPAVFFTYSRGALLGLIAVLVLMVFRMKQRLLVWSSVILAGIVVAAVFAPESWRQRMNPNGDVVDSSARSRLNAWSFCWSLASEYPVTGGGFATFTDRLFERYAPNSRDVHNSHSIYFGVLAEHGFVGLLFYGVLIWSCFATTGSVIRRARIYGDAEAMQYASMFRISVVGFLVSGMFLSRAYFDYYFTIVACIAILKRICDEAWARADVSEEEELEEVTA